MDQQAAGRGIVQLYQDQASTDRKPKVHNFHRCPVRLSLAIRPRSWIRHVEIVAIWSESPRSPVPSYARRAAVRMQFGLIMSSNPVQLLIHRFICSLFGINSVRDEKLRVMTFEVPDRSKASSPRGDMSCCAATSYVKTIDTLFSREGKISSFRSIVATSTQFNYQVLSIQFFAPQK